MKNTIVLFIIVTLASCKSTQENIMFDQKFDLCQRGKMYNNTLNWDVSKKEQFQFENFYSGFENGLLQYDFLNTIDKESYIQLTSKLSDENFRKIVIEKNQIGGELEKLVVYEDFYGDMGCLAALIVLYQLVDKNDFRYSMHQIGGKIQVAEKLDKIEPTIELIKTIPKREFQKIEYRRMVLRFIYRILIENNGR